MNPTKRTAAARKRARKTGASAKKLSSPRRNKKMKKKRKERRKSGLPFERRARDALQFLNPSMAATHNVHLPSVYGRRRQFDVTLSAGTVLERAFEAKDYGKKVALEKIEAFETKIRELEKPPVKGGAVISASGFQAGPIERARYFRKQAAPQALALDLYQLRPVSDADWEGQFRKLELKQEAVSFVAEGIRVHAIGDGEEASSFSVGCDRQGAFLYDVSGCAEDNLLDIINREIAQQRSSQVPPAEDTVHCSFARDRFLKIKDKLVRVTGVTFRVVPRTINSSVSIDLASGARDTLIDCVEGTREIIPDPQRNLVASRTGLDVSLAFSDMKDADLSALELPADVKDDPSVRLASALQLRIALECLRSRGEPQPPPPREKELVDEGTRNLLSGDLEAAKKLYLECWKTAASLEALVNLTFIYDKEGDIDQAQRWAALTAKLFPLEPNGFVNFIHTAVRAGALKAARMALDAARGIHDSEPTLVRAEADLLFQEGQYSEACGRFMELFHRGLDPAENRLNAAVCESKAGFVREAAFDAAAAWALKTLAPERGLLVIRLLAEAGRTKDAIEIGLWILQGNVTGSLADRVRLITAEACGAAGRVDEGRQLLAAVTAPDEFARYYYVAGTLSFSAGDYSAALDAFAKQAAKHPHTFAQWGIAVSASALGVLDAARNALEECGEDDAPTPADYWTLRARTFALLGVRDESERAVREAIRLGADAAQAWLSASTAALSRGHKDLFIALRLPCLDLKPADPKLALEQAILLIDRMLVGRSGDCARIAQLLERAGAHPDQERLLFARLLFGLRTRDASTAKLWEERKSVGLRPELAELVAAVAEFAGEYKLALDVLETCAVTTSTDSGLPDPLMVKAGALLGLGEIVEAQRILKPARATAAHPQHSLMLAYSAYMDGALDVALSNLDVARSMIGGHLECELLRLQCLMEAGRYREAFRLVTQLAPQTPISECAEWWADGGLRDAPRVDRIPDCRPWFGHEPGVEHAVLGVEDGLPFIVVGATTWESGFQKLRECRKAARPVLLRIKPPIETIRRLRARPR